MALDGLELRKFLAKLAEQIDADHIILRPTATKAWEYNREGILIKGDVSPLQVVQGGRRLVCTPAEPGAEGFWNCALFDEADNVLREITKQFPE